MVRLEGGVEGGSEKVAPKPGGSKRAQGLFLVVRQNVCIKNKYSRDIFLFFSFCQGGQLKGKQQRQQKAR